FPHGLGLEAKGGFDRWDGAAIADQRDHTGDGRLVSAPTKEGCSGPCAERLVTDLTLEARSLLAVNTNVALPSLPSCGTVHIRAQYVWRTHRRPPGVWRHSGYCRYVRHFFKCARPDHPLA